MLKQTNLVSCSNCEGLGTVITDYLDYHKNHEEYEYCECCDGYGFVTTEQDTLFKILERPQD